MPRYHVRRALLLALASGVASLLAFATPGLARAAGYGELTRFGGTGTEPGKFELEDGTQAFGVDPEDNSVYVTDAPGEEGENYRIQKLSSTGAVLASVEFKPPGCVIEKGIAVTPNECGSGIEGIAFDTVGTERRIYLLTRYVRTGAKIDSDTLAAGTLYAFSTVPTGEKLEPAAETTNGVLTSSTTLKAGSEEQGAALLNPKGITVDPTSHEVIVLGLEDVGKNGGGTPEERLALQRIKSNGQLAARYLDPEPERVEKFNSPVVTPSGQVLVEEAGGEIVQIPHNFGATEPTPVFHLPKEKALGKLLEWGGESGQTLGGGLTIGPEVLGGGGVIYANAEVRTNPKLSSNPGVLALHYETHGEEVTLSELGWVGGKSEAESGEEQCLISGLVEEEEEGEGEEEDPDRIVAAGKPGTVFVLDPEPAKTQRVIEFGESGKTTSCPKAEASEPEVTVENVKTTKVSAGQEVTLSSTVKAANALSVEWNFGDETEKTVSSDELQKTEVKHAFHTVGPTTVKEKIHVDNLASPALEETTKIEVAASKPKAQFEAPKEAAAEQAVTFNAKASSDPNGKAGLPLEYAWNFGDGTAEAKTKELTFEHKYTTAGTYEVKLTVTDKLKESGKAIPQSITITAASKEEAPKVTEEPKSVAVLEGEEASFEAKGSGVPAPEVQWELSTNGGAAWAPVSGAKADKLTIAKTKRSESKDEYRAVFSNGVSPNVTTSAVTLTVNQREAPTVTEGPRSVTVFEGEEASFEAKGSGVPAPEVQWELSTNGGATWAPVSGAKADKLTIAKAQASEDKDEFRAVFSNGVSPNATTSAVTLTVTKKPSGGGSGNGGGSSSSSESGNSGGSSSNNLGGGVLGVTTTVAPAVPDASLASASLVVAKSGAVTLKVTCPAGETSCAGTVTLRTVGAVSARATASAKKRILTLTVGSFTVAGGQLKAIILHLSATARKLLAKTHVLRARATIVAHDPAGAAHTTQMTVTLRVAKSGQGNH
jgi:PKD repeat protein